METLSLTFIEKFLIDRQCWALKDGSDVSYFKWVKNTNSNGPWGGCFTQALTSEQILKIWKIKL